MASSKVFVWNKCDTLEKLKCINPNTDRSVHLLISFWGPGTGGVCASGPLTLALGGRGSLAPRITSMTKKQRGRRQRMERTGHKIFQRAHRAESEIVGQLLRLHGFSFSTVSIGCPSCVHQCCEGQSHYLTPECCARAAVLETEFLLATLFLGTNNGKPSMDLYVQSLLTLPRWFIILLFLICNINFWPNPRLKWRETVCNSWLSDTVDWFRFRI